MTLVCEQECVAAADVQLGRSTGRRRAAVHVCRSRMAADASDAEAALQPHLVIRASADEVTKATPSIHSGSPHQATHKHTRKHSELLPQACQEQCNHPRLLPDNKEGSNASSNASSGSCSSNSQVELTHPSCLKCPTAAAASHSPG